MHCGRALQMGSEAEIEIQRAIFFSNEFSHFILSTLKAIHGLQARSDINTPHGPNLKIFSLENETQPWIWKIFSKCDAGRAAFKELSKCQAPCYRV